MNLKHTTGALLAFGLLSTAAFAATAPTPAQAFEDSCTAEHLGGGVWQIATSGECHVSIPAGAKKLSAVLVGSGGNGGKGDVGDYQRGAGGAGGVTYWGHPGTLDSPMELGVIPYGWGRTDLTDDVSGDVLATADRGQYPNEDGNFGLSCSAGERAVSMEGSPGMQPTFTCSGGEWEVLDARGGRSGEPTSHAGDTFIALTYIGVGVWNEEWDASEWVGANLETDGFVPALPGVPHLGAGGGGAGGAAHGNQGGEGLHSFSELGTQLDTDLNSLWADSTWGEAFGDDGPIAQGGSAGEPMWGVPAEGWGSGGNEDRYDYGQPGWGFGVVRYELGPDVSADVDLTRHRNWDWAITKDVDHASPVTVAAGETFKANYTITTTPTEAASHLEGRGSFSVSNPFGDQPITVVIGQPLSSVAGLACELRDFDLEVSEVEDGASSVEIPVGSTLSAAVVCPDTQVSPDAVGQLTFPVTWEASSWDQVIDIDMADVNSYPNRNANVSVWDTAPEFIAKYGEYDGAESLEIYAVGGPQTFTYSRDLGPVNAGTCETFENTASVHENFIGRGVPAGPEVSLIASDDADMTVCSVGAPMTDFYVNPVLMQEWDWGIEKDVTGVGNDPVADIGGDPVNVHTGDDVDVHYAVTVTPTRASNTLTLRDGSVGIRNTNSVPMSVTIGSPTILPGAVGLDTVSCTRDGSAVYPAGVPIQGTEVDGGLEFVIPAGSTLRHWWGCTGEVGDSGTGTVSMEVSWLGGSENFTHPINVATALIDTGSSVDAEVLVFDTAPEFGTEFGEPLQIKASDGPQTFRYTRTLGSDVPGGECRPFENTAAVHSLPAEEHNLLRGGITPFGAGPADTLLDSSDADVTVCASAPGWTLAKTSDPVSASTIATGTDITYTLTATNTGDVALTGLTARDDMTGVLDNAIIKGTLPAGLTQSGTTLVWTIPSLAAAGTVGDSVSVSYTVTVDPTAFNVRLTNSVYGDPGTTGNPPPAACYQESPCSTWHETPVFPTPPNLPLLGSTSMAVLLTTGGLLLAAAVAVAVYRRRHTPAVAGLSDPDSAPVDSDTHTQN